MDSFSEIFALAKEYCRGELSEVAYGLWIKDIEPLSMDGTVATLYVRSEFKKNIIQEKYLDLLGRAMENVLGEDSCKVLKINPVGQPGGGRARTAGGGSPRFRRQLRIHLR